jgi:hypothetical protein
VPVKTGMFLRPPGYEFVVVRISSPSCSCVAA